MGTPHLFFFAAFGLGALCSAWLGHRWHLRRIRTLQRAYQEELRRITDRQLAQSRLEISRLSQRIVRLTEQEAWAGKERRRLARILVQLPAPVFLSDIDTSPGVDFENTRPFDSPHAVTAHGTT